MTLPQQDAVDAMRQQGMIDPRVFDPSREPFAGTVDPETGEILERRAPASERRTVGGPSTGWPPRSRGPLPPADRIPPDLNIGTATDEIDAWAHEHDAATTALERIRRERTEAQLEVMKARMKYRRIARANPAERGRRTADDIKDEVDEALASDPQFVRLEQLEDELETQTGRLFRAKDNIARLDNYVKSLPRDGNYRP
jgi:hypothetical protein